VSTALRAPFRGAAPGAAPSAVLSPPLAVPVLPIVPGAPYEPDAPGPPLPEAPEPITDGGDRLVVALPVAGDRPSATLLAAQQLSDEADPHGRHQLRILASTAARRQRALRALVDQRRAEREAAARSGPGPGSG
jgi:hypothetical protein